MSATIGCPAGNSDNSQAQNTSAARRESTTLHDSKLIDALRHSKLYRDYERTFTAVTGLPLALRPVEFFALPFHGKTNENGFCAFLADRKSSCSLCLQTQSRVAENPGKHSHSIQCPFGLTETAVPIRVGERAIGFLCTGQVFTREPKSSNSTVKRNRLFAEGSAAEQKALRLWKQTPQIDAVKYKAMVRLLAFFSKQLSALSNQLLIEQKCREPEVIMRARRFVADNKRGRVSLSSAAKAAGASMFHFCTLFRQTTGLKFSDYVARSRIENARVLLCDPRRRMCEVASEAGFQSMTAFNRAFRRVVGQSPTEYRTDLAAHGSHTRASSFHPRDLQRQSSGGAYHSRSNGSASKIRSTRRHLYTVGLRKLAEMT
jgi:AraC-like DNA-binding protein/ligand-binding sensor protein